MHTKATTMLAGTAKASKSRAMRSQRAQILDRASITTLTSPLRPASETSTSAGPSQVRQPLSLSAHFQTSNAFRCIRTKSSLPQSDPIASEDSSSPSSSSTIVDDRFTSAASEELLQAPNETNRQPIGKLERRLSITFTCTVTSCGHRSSHEFSRHAYEKGIVLCQCPQCHSRHLIADHLGWFDSDDLTQGGKYKTIEALLAAKGEQVARAKVNSDGTMEIEKNEEAP